MNSKGRLIIHGPRDPLFNMACDEALGLCVTKPVLRFYTWEPPALSLGYFQKKEDVMFYTGSLGDPPVVRRITGGGAIYHYKELTYSLVSVRGEFRLPAKTSESYRYLHAPFISLLNRLGIPAQDNYIEESEKETVCFDSITLYDVAVNGKKIMGSAQRRTAGFFLQHGSLPLGRNPFSKRATSIKEETGSEPDKEKLINMLIEEISSHLNVEFQPSDLTEEENDKIKLIMEEKDLNLGKG